MSPTWRSAILCAIGAAAVLHILFLGDWAVEDAAISWAYARNLADGLGLVPWNGSEPVEGYSNPTWVALIALVELFGVHAFYGTRLLSTTLTAATVVLVHQLAVRAVPRSPTIAPLAAAAFFALNTQVAIFGAAGLENPLFNFLLAAGLLRALHEQEHENLLPWSALLFVGLTLTRPEGLAYGLVAGALTTVRRIRDGRDRVELSRWWLLLLAPLLAYHFARWNYFSWELPATAYAKLPESRAHLAIWDAPGWRYLRDYAWNTGQGFLLPTYVVAIAGVRERGPGLALAVIVPGILLYAVPGSPDLGVVRCAFPLAAGAALWVASLRSPDGNARGLMWAMGMIATFFAVYARGDWMDGTRWMTMAAVPAAVLLAAGVSDLAELAGERTRPAVGPAFAGGALALFAALQLVHTHAFSHTLEISPWMVRDRVWKSEHLKARLHVDHRLRILTVDMGGFLMWSDAKLNDIVGLTDIPIAMNRPKPWKAPFFIEYLVDENRPDFIFLGKALGEMRRWPRFADTYVKGPFGWEVRKDLLFSERWTGPRGRSVQYDGTRLVGWDIPEPEVAAGSSFYFELGLDNRDDRKIRAWCFLVASDGSLAASWAIPIHGPPTEDWPDDMFFHGRYTLDLPPNLPEGDYRVGFAMRTFDALNRPLPDAELPPGVVASSPPLLRPGEVIFPEVALRVVSRNEAHDQAEIDRMHALEELESGACEDGARSWFLARRHGTSPEWAERHARELDTAAARCWFARGKADPEQAVDAWITATDLDPELPGLVEAKRALADELVAAGHKHRRADRVDQAYQSLSQALRLDPYRPWIRHEAEDLRAIRMQRILDQAANPKAR